MHFSESLKKNKDFQIVYRKGQSYANKYLVMYIYQNQSERNRLGISVSKKVGNSVVRHRLTRFIDYKKINSRMDWILLLLREQVQKVEHIKR